jgi:Skp family chaperone for outer membrane proteins
MPMPPVPELPALPKGVAPPAAVVGVIGVPEVMRASTAAQAVDKIISERREKLNADAQREQEAWRGIQQALANERGKLSPDQLRAREKELQDRITNAQRSFRDRNRILQEQTQFALNQIQASLIGVIRQVAESRGMNLVLHRAQVALNVNEFDITELAAEQLNLVLASVVVPPEGVSPVQTANVPKGPVATPAAGATPKKP